MPKYKPKDLVVETYQPIQDMDDMPKWVLSCENWGYHRLAGTSATDTFKVLFVYKGGVRDTLVVSDDVLVRFANGDMTIMSAESVHYLFEKVEDENVG